MSAATQKKIQIQVILEFDVFSIIPDRDQLDTRIALENMPC